MPTEVWVGARVRIHSPGRIADQCVGRVTETIRRHDGTVAYVAVKLTDASRPTDAALLYKPSEVEVL